MKLLPNTTKLIQIGIAVITVLALLLVSWQYLQPIKGIGTTDFAIYYVVGGSITKSGALTPHQVYNHTLLRKAVLDVFSGAATHFLYPPTALVWFAPFTVLPFRAAVKWWGMLNVLVYIGTFYLTLIVLLKEHNWYRWYYSGLLALLFLSAPWKSLIDTGQVNALIWLGLILMILGLQKQWPWLVGISLGSIIALKIFPIIFIPYLLLRKQYRAVVIMIGTLVVLTLITLPWFGVADWYQFCTATLPDILRQSGGAAGHTSISLYGSLRYGIKNGTWDWLQIAHTQLIDWAGYLQKGVVVVTGLGLIIFTWWTKRRDWLLEVSLWLVWLLLTAQIVQMQYSIWLLPVLLYVMVKPKPERHWLLAAGLVVIGTVLMQFSKTIGLPDVIFGTVKPITLGLSFIVIALIGLLLPHRNPHG